MPDNEQITWTNEIRKLSELIPWTHNPRQINTEQTKRLQESLTEFGQPEPVAIGPGNELYNGHQRLKSWIDEFGDIEVDVRVSSRPLTEKERKKLTVFLHKGTIGEWDFKKLTSEFNIDDLVEWGFKKHEIGVDGFDYNLPDLPLPNEDIQGAYIVYVTFASFETFAKGVTILSLGKQVARESIRHVTLNGKKLLKQWKESLP